MIVVIRWKTVPLGGLLASGSCLVRLLAATTAGLALCATTTADVSPYPAPPPDPRAGRLEVFFRTYNCPQPHHISDYLRAADQYELDYRLLPAVSVRETTCGVAQKENNRWGYHPGRQSFSSVKEGIDYVARQLAENPLYKNKTLHQKLFTYNPRPSYPDEVKRIMHQIE